MNIAKIEIPIYRIVVTPPEFPGYAMHAAEMIIGSVAPEKNPARNRKIKNASEVEDINAARYMMPPVRLVNMMKILVFFSVRIKDAIPLLKIKPMK